MDGWPTIRALEFQYIYMCVCVCVCARVCVCVCALYYYYPAKGLCNVVATATTTAGGGPFQRRHVRGPAVQLGLHHKLEPR